MILLSTWADIYPINLRITGASCFHYVCIIWVSRETASVTCICKGISLLSVLTDFIPRAELALRSAASPFPGRKVWLAAIRSDHSRVLFIHTTGKNNRHWIQWHSGILVIKHCLGALKKKRGKKAALSERRKRFTLLLNIYTSWIFTQVFYERFGPTCCKGTRSSQNQAHDSCKCWVNKSGGGFMFKEEWFQRCMLTWWFIFLWFWTSAITFLRFHCFQSWKSKTFTKPQQKVSAVKHTAIM